MGQSMTLNGKDLTIVDGAEELASESGLDIEAAIRLTDIVEFRRSNRASNRADFVVIVDEEYSEWALEAETNVVLVSEMEDYVNKFGENKSYKVYGAAKVNQVVLDGEESTITESLTTIDETEKDFIQERGQTWFPKQYVEAIIAFE